MASQLKLVVVVPLVMSKMPIMPLVCHLYLVFVASLTYKEPDADGAMVVLISVFLSFNDGAVMLSNAVSSSGLYLAKTVVSLSQVYLATSSPL